MHDASLSISRRRFGQVTGGALASAIVSPFACALDMSALQNFEGRLSVRTRTGVRTTASGTQSLGLDQTRDAILQMPVAIPSSPMPLLVLLHGAGGSADRQLQRMGSAPSDAGVAVLAPFSRGSSWDAIRGRFGPDVSFLSRALDRVFDLVSVDPARLVIGGFSDGACVRAISRSHQRPAVQESRGVLARLRRDGDAGRQAARVHFTRNARRRAAHRALRPRDCPAVAREQL